MRWTMPVLMQRGELALCVHSPSAHPPLRRRRAHALRRAAPLPCSHAWATKSNKQRLVKTPGGKLVYQLKKKPASIPTCPISGQQLNGVRHLAGRQGRDGWEGRDSGEGRRGGEGRRPLGDRRAACLALGWPRDKCGCSACHV